MKFTDFHNSELAEASKTRNPTRDFLRNNPVSSDQMAKPVKQMSVPELATVSDEALDNAYHYGRSTPGNTFGWQANLKSAAYAKQLIDKGVTDIEQISDAIHKGWNVTARAFVQNPDQFDDTEKLKAAGKLEAKLQQRAKLMNIEYAQLPDDEQEKDRVVARALLQAIKGQQGVAEGSAEDNLNELDKSTLGSYVKKAAADVNTKSRDAQQHKDMWAGDYPVRGAKKQARQNQADIDKRVGGISRAVDRLAAEDVAEGYWADAVTKEEEQIDELSKDTLKSYAKKAVPDLYASHKKAEAEHLKAASAKTDRSAKKHYDAAVQAKNRAEKRTAGIAAILRKGADARAILQSGTNKKGVAEAKADLLGAWIAHKNGTEARKFKTREGAKKYVASHEGFTVSSSEAFHDTYRKKKVQEVKKFRTTYGWAGGSKEPRSAHAKQVATKRKEYDKGLGKFEPTDDMVGTAKIVRDIAMSDASPEHKKAAIDALNKKGVAEGSRNAYLKHNNLVDLKKPLAGLENEFDKFLQTHDPEVKQKYQQGIKDRIKTGTMAGPKGVLPEQGVAEEYNPEYDDEAGMADNNLSTLRRAVDGLDDLIDTGDNLPEWCQEKIAVAKSMLVNVWNYMESEDDVMAEGEKWIQKAVNPKTKGNLHKALHVPQDETIPKSRIAQAIHSADPHLRHMAQFAKNVAKEDAGGMGTGSVATSMGAGNGFANGGPGTITRRRK